MAAFHSNRRRAVQLALGGAVAGAVAALVGPAAAHHGWNWAEEAQTELKGTIR